MAKAKPQWYSGLTGDDYNWRQGKFPDGTPMSNDPKKFDIPQYLHVENRVPLAPELAAALNMMHKTLHPERKVDFRKPKGMGDEEWEALQATQAAERKARFAALPQGEPKPKSLRTGLLDLDYFAEKLGTRRRLVYRALRLTNTPKPAWGWCFAQSDEQRILGICSTWLKTSKRKGATKADLPKVAEKKTSRHMPKLAKRRAKAKRGK